MLDVILMVMGVLFMATFMSILYFMKLTTDAVEEIHIEMKKIREGIHGE